MKKNKIEKMKVTNGLRKFLKEAKSAKEDVYVITGYVVKKGKLDHRSDVIVKSEMHEYYKKMFGAKEGDVMYEFTKRLIEAGQIDMLVGNSIAVELLTPEKEAKLLNGKWGE